MNPCTANEKLTTIKKKLYLLFEAYSETLSHNASSNASSGQIRIPTSREDDSLSFDVPDVSFISVVHYINIIFFIFSVNMLLF